MKRPASVLAVSAAAVALLGTPAQGAVTAPAAESCATAAGNTTVLDLPGAKPDTLIGTDVCSVVSGGRIRAEVTVRWQIVDDQVIDRSTRFTSFRVTSRLEHRGEPAGADTVAATAVCDLTEQLNAAYANSVGVTCSSPAAAFDADLWWSGDATVVYDLADDGKGPITWQLTGSPLTG
ncbi:hypothetical protein GCM10027168_04990 [Streptomyces capparidis]